MTRTVISVPTIPQAPPVTVALKTHVVAPSVVREGKAILGATLMVTRVVLLLVTREARPRKLQGSHAALTHDTARSRNSMTAKKGDRKKRHKSLESSSSSLRVRCADELRGQQHGAIQTEEGKKSKRKSSSDFFVDNPRPRSRCANVAVLTFHQTKKNVEA